MDQREFCETILRAASKLHFVAKLDQINGQYLLHLGDRQTGAVISGTLSITREDALESACKALVEHLKMP